MHKFVIYITLANFLVLKAILVNPMFTTREIKTQLENADVQAVFTFPAKFTDVQKSIEKNSKIKLPIVIVDNGTDAAPIPETIKLDDLMHDNIEEFSKSQKTDVSYDDTVILPSSSGTTGPPKIVEIAHRCANRLHILYVFKSNLKYLNTQNTIQHLTEIYYIYNITM